MCICMMRMVIAKMKFKDVFITNKVSVLMEKRVTSDLESSQDFTSRDG